MIPKGLIKEMHHNNASVILIDSVFIDVHQR